MKIPGMRREEVVVGLLAIGAYAACLANNFHSDDWLVMSTLRDGFSFGNFLSMENPGRFRPLTNIVVCLRYLAFGDRAFYYYALSVLLHAFISILLYRLLLKIEMPRAAALTAAIFFAVYFQHYEAVLWLYGIIRELAALAYIISLWHLHSSLVSGSGKSFRLFVLFSFLGFFVVEDFVIAPLIFVAFVLFFSAEGDRGRHLARVAATVVFELVVYLSLRSLALSAPGIGESHYHFGFHLVRRFFEYMGWFVIPSPGHSYFAAFSGRIPQAAYLFWKGLNYIAMFGFLPISIWLFAKSPKQVRFFIILVFLALLPVLPLDLKVSSRTIYVPSIGLAVTAGYVLSQIIVNKRPGLFKKAVLAAALGYAGISVAAITVTSMQYHKTQVLVDGIVNDLQKSGMDLNRYSFVLLDDLPGRAIVGPEMMYKLGFRNDVVASNDAIAGPIDIAVTADSLYNKGVPFIVFDYRDGHMVEATRDYVGKRR